MKQLIKQLLVLAVLFMIAMAKDTSTIKEQKLRQMAKDKGIIVFNSTGFNHFVMEKHRQYDVVIYFTGNTCEFCNKIEKELERGLERIQNADSSQNPVFFGKMTYDYATQQTFQQLNFTTIPNLIVFKPEATNKMTKTDKYLKKFTWSISGTDGSVNAQKLLNFINGRTLREIQYQEPLSKIIFLLIVVLSVLSFGGFIVYKFHSFIFHQLTKHVVSQLIYVVCMSGIVYNIIHNVPFTGADGKGNVIWFQQSDPRGQYGLEGVVVSSMISLSGLFILAFLLFNQKVETTIMTRLISLLLVLLSFFFICQIEGFYKSKGYYQIQFYPPEHYQKGPLSADQGISI